MTSRATITFIRADAQPPVFVVTSLSTPPWEVLEMDASADEYGRRIFSRHFDNVKEGTYQYKVRIGESQWVLDESKDTGHDSAGNCNNIVCVERSSDSDMQTCSNLIFGAGVGDGEQAARERSLALPVLNAKLDAPTEHYAGHRFDEEETAPLFPHEFSGPNYNRHDSSESVTRSSRSHSPHMETIEEESITSAVDQSPEPNMQLAADDLKTNEHDSRPLFEYEVGPPNKASDLGELDHAPLMRHETGPSTKVKNRSASVHEPVRLERHDSGPSIEVEQKDQEERDELYRAPLMRHESNMVLVDDFRRYSSGARHERSVIPHGTSSTTHNNESSDAVERIQNFENDVFDDSDELDRAPLMRHETNDRVENAHDTTRKSSQHHSFPYETSEFEYDDVGDEEEVNELDRAPTMSHETGTSPLFQSSSMNEPSKTSAASHTAEIIIDGDDSDGTDELDHAPSLPHERGCSSGSGNNFGSDGAPLTRYDTNYLMADNAIKWSIATQMLNGDREMFGAKKPDSFTPERLRESLRGSTFSSTRQLNLFRNGSSEAEYDLDRAMLSPQPSKSPGERSRGGRLEERGYQTTTDDMSKSFPFFARRLPSYSSSLPHSLPRSDEEDNNLHDPRLEHFPIDRDQVFDRVADIGNRLPEDVLPMPSAALDSPAVISQACSSVDLVPIRTSSSASLVSISEEDSPEGDDDREGESMQLPSPVLQIAHRASRLSKMSPGNDFATGDGLATPMPQNARAGYFEEPEQPSTIDEGSVDLVTLPLYMHQATPTGSKDDGDNICIDADKEENSRRWGKMFGATVLPPHASTITQTNMDDDSKHVVPRHASDSILKKLYQSAGRAIRMCVTRAPSIFIVAILAVGMACFWRQT